ncbi:MAG: extracellular solute-binding protein [Lachnospiraceae bacterium]|nr:extracellular solute-binding protein [Lachnospiraceae bacterium]
MIRGSIKRSGSTAVALILTLAMVILTFEPYTAFMAATGSKLKDKYVGFEGVPVEWKYGAGENVFSYKETSQTYQGTADAAGELIADISAVRDENGVVAVTSFEGRDAFFSSGESEYFEFDVDVPSDAVYRVEFDYYLPKGNSDSAQRALYVDGEYPFTEAGGIEFERFFKDEGEPVLNSIGDETRPKQITIDGWRTAGLKDTSGITSEDFNIKLSSGKHTIRLVTMKTGMYVSGIRLCAPKQVRSYAEVSAEYAAKGYQDAAAQTINFQAELTAVEKNDPTLRRENDGDPYVVPKSDVTRKLNVMGGYRWRKGNQSITWEFDVDADGLYKIGLYVKQQWNDGLPSYRQIAIDGEVPFAELMEYKFEYDTKWRLRTLSDANDNPYQFYLTKGKHTLTMTVKMGELGDVLTSIQEDIIVLSDMLLDINLIAGSSPDPNYDYKFFEKIPDMQEQMEYLLASMEYKYQYVKGMSEKTPAIANNFLTIKAQIQGMLEDPFSIAKKTGDLQNSQKNLSDWYLSLQNEPLVIDSFYVGPASENWVSKSSNFFQRLGVTFKQFISSFSKDYDNVGGVLAEDVVVTDTITVWIARGTEWAEVIKEMADEDFTPKTGIAIKVNVLPASQLNAGNVNAIMLSITSGKAPDVALGVDVTSPVEFAIRDQVYDLSQMEGFEEVKDRFVPATLTPYEYRGGIYAIPETMNFNVMYYRKDLLSKFGIDLPNTWEDMYNYVLPALYQEGLQFYFARDFTQFLYQNGGAFYTEDGMKSALDTPEAYLAFKEYTELFTNYGVPETANFYQYFRSGIMPLGVGDFNMYMQLSVAAPEISGKWGIVPLPGHITADGEIDRTAGGITEKGDIIMKQSEKPKQSWEFLKWWSSAEVQTRFAKEVEAMIGAEARWNTANKEAFMSLAWNAADIATLEEEWKWAKEIPTVLGGYMTTRHLTNAWTSVVISGMDIREAMERAVKDINRELVMKQEEYGVISND